MLMKGVDMSQDKLTNAFGAPVVDNQNCETAGKRGPLLLQSLWYMEKIAQFDREVIPERRMHAKGSGAFGTFKVTNDITKYTKAKLFSEIGKETPIFVRFSLVAPERGGADAERDTRGFAIKFYTEEGNWDLVGNNLPVFFIRDPLKFPDLNHAVKRDPQTNLRSPQAKWDFWTNLPESFHQVTMQMSDRGIPASYRHMHGFGVHAFAMINDKNERVWVKFTHKCQQGIKNWTDEEAESVIAKDRDSHQRDLFENIAKGNFPKWTMYIQVMTEEQADECPFNPFDATKVWSHKDYPLIEVGEFELNKNPENYFQDVEQSAFSPSNFVPGISFSPDRLLQGRLFSYPDAQRYRLGVNYPSIPVNAPKCPVNSFHRDGKMRVDGNYGAKLNYEPNGYGIWQEQPEFQAPGIPVCGEAINYDFREDDDDYFSQARALFHLMNDEEKKRLFKNTANDIEPASKEVKIRHIKNCLKCDPEYGKGVADAIGLLPEEYEG